MRKIGKGAEPESLTQWKKTHSHGNYDDLTFDVRQDIRTSCATEQYYLCAYCCQSISGDNYDTVNEHVEARYLAPQRSLDFTNIVASCKTANRCDSAHGSHFFQLTPFMDECETELIFKISGRVKGLTDRAKEMISALNLGDNEKNNRALIEQRKQLSDAILWSNSIDPSEGLDDDALIQILIDDIQQPKSGRLVAFAPVVINIAKGWITR